MRPARKGWWKGVCLWLTLQTINGLGASAAGTNASGLPASVDLRPTFALKGLERRQQGKRPTCSVFTVAGAIEYALARQQKPERLSVEFLNWAANQVTGANSDGGFFSDLWKGYQAHGICSEAELPYEADFRPTHRPPEQALASAKGRLDGKLRLHWIKQWDVETGLTDQQFKDIKGTMRMGWPVCAGLRWPKEEVWRDGVLVMCGPEAVRDGHSVLLAGYEDNPHQPGGGVFLFRNTSGAGRDGSMPYAYARQYMNDAAWVEAVGSPGSAAAAGNPGGPKWSGALDPLGALARPITARNRRISSNQQPAWNDANMDMTLLTPGQRVDFPLLKGPGVITHIWFTSHAGRVNELNSLTLRIYWDDRAEPAVEVPVGEFFAVGQGQPAEVESFPVQVSPSGSLSSFWRMPFNKSARIVVSNDNPDRTAGLYWQVDWSELAELPPETPYFHARYRQEYPARPGDYVVADLEGRGHYVGTVMSVTLGQDGWWGEGDDFFFVDGETVPSLQGTGSEDYFNDAWGFRSRTSHWFGQPRWQGDFAGDSGVCYRWHVLDPVVFEKSLRFTLEHKGNHEDDINGFYVERPDFINSVAFWYQTGEPKRSYESIPDYAKRRVPWEQHHFVRAYRELKVSGTTRPQVQFAGMFGARPVLSWTNSVPGMELVLPFKVEEPARYAVRLTAGSAPGFGKYRISLNGQTALPEADFQTRNLEETDLSLGTHALPAGTNQITFTALPAEGNRAKPLAVEMLRILKLPPEAKRTVKDHNEAHFIRLGIGRAVYAYRMAYGRLPEGLEELVGAGLLPSRYLKDENQKALKSRLDGEYFVVESDGAHPWTHRWQGLDARR